MQQFANSGVLMGRHFLMVLAAGVLAAGTAMPAAAQEYETLPFKYLPKDGGWTSKQVSQKKADVLKVLRGQEGPPVGAKKQVLTEFFEGYFFPQMTHPERLTDLTSDRQKDFAFFTRATPLPTASVQDAKAAHDELIKMTLTYMMDNFVNPDRKFHPAVKYNAMMLVADLNEVEAALVGDKHPAEPYYQALLACGTALKHENQIDAVRVAALLGILRYAERDGERLLNDPRKLKSSTRTYINDLMLQIVKGDQPPGSRSPDGQLWMARRAIDVIGAFGDPGENEKYVKELVAIITDAKAPMSLRADAAVALGRMQVPPARAATFPAKETAEKLAQMASQVARRELKTLVDHQKMVARLKEEQKKKSALGGSPYGFPGDDGGLGGSSILPDDGGASEILPDDGGGFDPSGGVDSGFDPSGGLDGGFDPSGGVGGYGDPYGGMPKVDVALRENYRVDLSRRRLSYYEYCILAGFDGMYGSKTGLSHLGPNANAEQSPVNKIKDCIKDVKAAAEKATARPGDTAPTPEAELQKYIDDLTTAVKDLEAAANIKATEPIPASDPTLSSPEPEPTGPSLPDFGPSLPDPGATLGPPGPAAPAGPPAGPPPGPAPAAPPGS